MLPLQSVSVKAELRGVWSSTQVDLCYSNPSETNPLECSFTFPLEKNTTLAKLEVSIDERVMQTKIQEIEKARERYDDAIAGGKAAVIGERKKQDEIMTVKLGNVLPGQKATLKATILSQMEVVGGHLGF